MIYAFGSSDKFSYHSMNRGARSLNLLNYVKNAPPPKIAQYFDILSVNVRISVLFMHVVIVKMSQFDWWEVYGILISFQFPLISIRVNPI